MAVEDLGRKGFERRKGEGRVEAEGARETMGSREGGGGKRTWLVVGPPQVGGCFELGERVSFIAV